MLREVITEAMTSGKAKNEQIEARMKDVESAISLVKNSLLSALPKQRRSGRVLTTDLQVTVLNEQATPAAA